MSVRGLVLVAAVAASAVAACDRPPPRAIIEYAVEPPPGVSLTDARARAIEGARDRIDRRGVTLVIRATAAGFAVELAPPDPAMIDQVTEVLTRRATLAVHRVDDASPVMARLVELAATDPAAESAGVRIRSDPPPTALWGDERAPLEAWIARAAAADPTARLPPDRRLAYARVPPVATEARARARWRPYVVDAAPVLTSAEVTGTDRARDPRTDEPVLAIQLDAAGTRRLTDEPAAMGARPLAIVLDGEVRATGLDESNSRARLMLRVPDDRAAAAVLAVVRAGLMPAVREVRRTVPR